jgi:replicative DNA helicase
VFRLRLASGRELEATGNHPLMTLDGWTPLERLKVGDRIAVLRRVPEPIDEQRMSDSEVAFSARMVGGGSCVKNQPTLRLPALHHLTHRRCDRIAARPDTRGLFRLRGHEKFVPNSVFALPNEQVALFLCHLWATDGSVTWNQSTDHAEICYVSASRRLVDDIMQLLLRLRVCSQIVRVRKPGRRDCWHLHVGGAESQATFLRCISLRGKPAREVFAKLETRNGRPGAATILEEVRTEIGEALTAKGITQRATAMNARFADPRRIFARDRLGLHDVAAVREGREINALGTSDVFWDKIVEITDIGERNVYDGTVPGTNNFVAQGISVHNSLEQDADMVVLLHRPDAFERDDPRGGEADLILAKHRNGPTKTVTVAHQLHLSRFANMAR